MTETPFVPPDADTPAGPRRLSAVSWLPGVRSSVAWSSVAIVLAAAALRLVASWDDFWFDEIWSWQFATTATSFWQIATGIRHDNNHILNTWIIHLFPPQTHWTVYRIPAVLAGTGTVILAGLCGFRRSRCEGLTALLLTGSSFVLVQYASEARGYAYVIFLTMLCVWLMERLSTAPRVRDQWLLAVSASCGFLAHLSFVAAYIGLIAWSITFVRRSSGSWPGRLKICLRLHALPLLTLAGLLWTNGQLQIGGGNRSRVTDVVVQAGSLAVGGPDSGWLAVVACCGCVAASVAAVVLQFRRGHAVAGFWVTTTTVFAVTLIAQPGVLYVRYLVIEIAGALVLISHLLAWTWSRGTAGRLVYVAAVATLLLGNAIPIRQLLKYGRGGYQAAVAYLQANSPSARIAVSSDHDFRNSKVLEYYQGRLTSPKPIDYFRQGTSPAGGLDWIILHSFQQPPAPLAELRDAAGHHYRLARAFPCSGLSGWHWFLYRRDDETRRQQ